MRKTYPLCTPRSESAKKKFIFVRLRYWDAGMTCLRRYETPCAAVAPLARPRLSRLAVGVLQDSKLAVTPVVAYMGNIDPSQFASSFNPSEVAEVFTVTIHELMNVHKRVTTQRFGINFPAFEGGPHRIWGLTAYVLENVLSVVLPQPVKDAKL
eukprot:m.219620 g.219620  ORF g.219620 m.219620 type:complete len:154 (+) comp54135_c1_seq1:68-529(+)